MLLSSLTNNQLFTISQPSFDYQFYLLPVETWNKQDLVCDTLKNACDLSLPLKALGYLPNVNPALIAFLGTMSSLFGIFPLVNPEYKMP